MIPTMTLSTNGASGPADRSKASEPALERRQRPRAFRSAGHHGRAYRDLTPADERDLATWLEAGRVADGEEIKPGRVYAHGSWIVKLFPAGRRWRDVLRPAPAVRCARHHARLRHVRTPRPIATLEARDGRSLVVLERIRGRTLERVFAAREAEPIDAFVQMMVAMHRARIFHGDLHPDQLIWDGDDWFLLDLDGLRHPLRALQRRSIIEGQWARLGRSIPVEELRAPFASYLARAGWGWEPTRAWERVLRRREELERAARATTGSSPDDPVACASTSASASRSLSA